MLFSLVYLIGQAQVGVNTEKPQGIFHVDPKHDTSGTANTSDDFVITNSGTVGIGVISPAATLDINGSLRIASPSSVTTTSQLYNPMYWDQSTGKVLVTMQTTANAALTISANKYTLGNANNTMRSYMFRADNSFYLPAITASSTSSYYTSTSDSDVFSIMPTTGNIKVKNRGKNLFIQFNQSIKVSLDSTVTYPTSGIPPQILCSIDYSYKTNDANTQRITLSGANFQNKLILPKYSTTYGQISDDTYYSLSSPFSSTVVIPVAKMPVPIGSYFYLVTSINIYSSTIRLASFYSDGFGVNATANSIFSSSYSGLPFYFSISEF